jgi:hypothetical protein
VRLLYQIVETLRGLELNLNPDLARKLLTGMINELAQFIERAEAAVAPVADELLVASGRTRSAHQEVITLAGDFMGSLERLRAEGVIGPGLQPWLAGVGLAVDRFMAGFVDNRVSAVRHVVPKSGIDFEMNRAAALRSTRNRSADEGGSTPAGQPLQPSDGRRPAGTVRPERSTPNGNSRSILFISILSKHHRYAEVGFPHTEPIKNKELARQASVAPATASEFFKKKFGGHGKYKSLCELNPGKLALKLADLNGDRTDRNLPYGYEPGGEDIRGEG